MRAFDNKSKNLLILELYGSQISENTSYIFCTY